MAKKATIREVAARAGVSSSTVSRVLNGHSADHMRLETKERVLLAIEELEYVPVKAAQTLRRQRTQVIGILLPDISNSFFCTPGSSSGRVRTIGRRRYKMRSAVDDLTSHISAFLSAAIRDPLIAENSASGNTVVESFFALFREENASLFNDASNIWDLERGKCLRTS